MPRFSIAAAAANMAQYLSQNQGGQMKSNHGALVDRTHLYWPGLQGLVANPMAWRDRLGSSELHSSFCVCLPIKSPFVSVEFSDLSLKSSKWILLESQLC
jgi:hypothetical protein